MIQLQSPGKKIPWHLFQRVAGAHIGRKPVEKPVRQPQPHPYAAIPRPAPSARSRRAPELASSPARRSPRASPRNARRISASSRVIWNGTARSDAMPIASSNPRRANTASTPTRPHAHCATLAYRHIQMQARIFLQAGQGAPTATCHPVRRLRPAPPATRHAGRARATPAPIPPARLRRHEFPARCPPGNTMPANPSCRAAISSKWPGSESVNCTGLSRVLRTAYSRDPAALGLVNYKN